MGQGDLLCNDRVVLEGGQSQLPNIEHRHQLSVVGRGKLAEHEVVEERVVHLRSTRARTGM